MTRKDQVWMEATSTSIERAIKMCQKEDSSFKWKKAKPVKM